MDKMDRMRALEITKDRIESMKQFTPSNSSEASIAKETMEYLSYIKTILEV